MEESELWDYFAAKAMVAYVQRYSDGKNIAAYAYDLADLMLKERELRRRELRRKERGE